MPNLIERLDALSEAATKVGPWKVGGNHRNLRGDLLGVYFAQDDGGVIGETFSNCGISDDTCQDNAAFIVALVNAYRDGTLREALRDAGRYQWIRENCFPHEYFSRPQPHVVLSVYLGHDEKGRLKVMHPGPESHVGIPSLDCAIDAAIDQERGERTAATEGESG